VTFLALWTYLSPDVCARASDKATAGSFDANGVKVACFVQGKGEPVILIHGWLSTAGINWMLPGTQALLAKSFQVISLDMRGHGMSDKPLDEAAYGPELVEDIVRLLDHLKIKKAHIVGYSMGGIVAGSFIVKHPDRVLSGTLGGMGCLKTGAVAQFALGQIGKNDANAKSMTICGRSLSKLALSPAEIKSIKVPMIILVGDKDDVVKKLYIEPLQRVRSDWKVVEIKDADHFTCILKPQFQSEILSWLKKNAA
jgi:pimeloyl-ACP methyl ester carboxylesterase